LAEALMLALTDKLSNGREYTFRFRVLSSFPPFESTLEQALLRAHSFLENVTVNRPFFSDSIAVSFRWTGLRMQVDDVANQIVEILRPKVELIFIEALGGRATETGPLTKVGEALESAGTKISLLAFALIAALLLTLIGLANSAFGSEFGKGLSKRI
jgi:hypothetical protein